MDRALTRAWALWYLTDVSPYLWSLFLRILDLTSLDNEDFLLKLFPFLFHFQFLSFNCFYSLGFQIYFPRNSYLLVPIFGQDNGFLLVIDGVRKEKERLTAAKLLHGPSFLLFIGSSSLLLLHLYMWLQELCFIQSLSYMFLQRKRNGNNFKWKTTTPKEKN
jgi:hypothetical protein